MGKFDIMLGTLVQQRVAEIEAKKEQYLAAWIAETGLKPSECVLVTRNTMDGYEFSVRKRKEGE